MLEKYKAVPDRAEEQLLSSETWINVVQNIWQEKNITTARQGHMEGWSTGIKGLSGKGKRLIIVRIGSEDGFLKKGLLTFKSNKAAPFQYFENSVIASREYALRYPFRAHHSREVFQHLTQRLRQIGGVHRVPYSTRQRHVRTEDNMLVYTQILIQVLEKLLET